METEPESNCHNYGRYSVHYNPFEEGVQAAYSKARHLGIYLFMYHFGNKQFYKCFHVGINFVCIQCT